MRRNHVGSIGAVVLFVSLVASQVIAVPPKKKGPEAASSASASAVPSASVSASVPQGPAPLAQSLTGDAKAEYESGRILYADGDFVNAFLKFKRAYELSKDGRLLWNMAVCEKNQRHYAKVLQLVNRYKIEAQAILTDQDKQEADDLVNAVKGVVSALRIRVEPADSTVFIDDERVGESPLLEPVLVDIGSRRLKVTKAGYLDNVQTLQVTAAEMNLNVKLERETHEGRLVVLAEPGQSVWLDGKAVGVGRWEGAVSSGGHWLRITEQGKKPYQTEVHLKDKETRQIRVTLEPEAATATATGKSATWIWIAGGVVVGAGLVVGSYFLFRPKDEESSPTAVGTMQPGTVQLPLYGFGR